MTKCMVQVISVENKKLKYETVMTANVLNKIQTHQRFKRTLFIKTKHNMRIFGVINFIKLQLKGHLTVKRVYSLPSSGHENNIAQPQTKDKCFSSICHCLPFNRCLTVVVLLLDKGDYHENSHVVSCTNK